MTPEQQIEYIRTVWENFTKRRGAPGNSMTSIDFSIISTWAKKGVPLRVILQGLEECSGKMTSETSFAYVKPAVEAEIDRWSRAMSL